MTHGVGSNVRNAECFNFFMMGLTSFDRVSNTLRATSEATDLISAKKVNANDEVYDMALAA